MKAWLLSVVVLFFGIPSFAAHQSELVIVTQVLKGDTFLIARQGHLGSNGGTGAYVHLVAVDCPELNQPYGPQAQQYAQSVALNQQVTMVICQQQGEHILARLYLGTGTKDIGAMILQNGYGFYRPEEAAGLGGAEDASYKSLAERAKYKKLGLWANGNFNYTIQSSSWRDLNTYKYQQQYINGHDDPSKSGFDRPGLGQSNPMPSQQPMNPRDPNDWRTPIPGH